MLSLAVAVGFTALAWDAPAGCPTREAIERDVETLSGVRAELDADARIEHVGREWRLSLSLPETAPRVLVSKTCEELGSAVAAILATRASMSAETAPPESPRPNIVEDEREPTPPLVFTNVVVATPDSFDRAAPSAPSRERFAATMSFGGSLGIPHTSAAIRAATSFTPGAARLEIYGVWSLPRTLTAMTESTKYAVAIAGARGCATARRGPFAIAPCVGAEGGVASATHVASNDSSYALAETERHPWFAATAGAILTARTGPVLLRVDVEAVVPTSRNMGEEFTVDSRQAWAVVPRGFLGAELPIP